MQTAEYEVGFGFGIGTWVCDFRLVLGIENLTSGNIIRKAKINVFELSPTTLKSSFEDNSSLYIMNEDDLITPTASLLLLPSLPLSTARSSATRTRTVAPALPKYPSPSSTHLSVSVAARLIIILSYANTCFQAPVILPTVLTTSGTVWP